MIDGSLYNNKNILITQYSNVQLTSGILSRNLQSKCTCAARTHFNEDLLVPTQVSVILDPELTSHYVV